MRNDEKVGYALMGAFVGLGTPFILAAPVLTVWPDALEVLLVLMPISSAIGGFLAWRYAEQIARWGGRQ